MTDWLQFDPESQTFGNGRLTVQYGFGYLHNGDGSSITRFEDAQTGHNYALGLMANTKGRRGIASRWF